MATQIIDNSTVSSAIFFSLPTKKAYDWLRIQGPLCGESTSDRGMRRSDIMGGWSMRWNHSGIFWPNWLIFLWFVRSMWLLCSLYHLSSVYMNNPNVSEHLNYYFGYCCSTKCIFQCAFNDLFGGGGGITYRAWPYDMHVFTWLCYVEAIIVYRNRTMYNGYTVIHNAGHRIFFTLLKGFSSRVKIGIYIYTYICLKICDFASKGNTPHSVGYKAKSQTFMLLWHQQVICVSDPVVMVQVILCFQTNPYFCHVNVWETDRLSPCWFGVRPFANLLHLRGAQNLQRLLRKELKTHGPISWPNRVTQMNTNFWLKIWLDYIRQEIKPTWWKWPMECITAAWKYRFRRIEVWRNAAMWIE